jgi:hypothetical protein
MTILVDVEIYDPNGQRVFQTFFDNQTLAAGQRWTRNITWTVPAVPGVYTVKLGVFGPGTWSPLYQWNDQATQFAVR